MIPLPKFQVSERMEVPTFGMPCVDTLMVHSYKKIHISIQTHYRQMDIDKVAKSFE